jgi:hypothetical protein
LVCYVAIFYNRRGGPFIYLFLLVWGGGIMRGKAKFVTNTLENPYMIIWLFSFSIYVRVPVTFGHCEAQTQRASPFPSWATERKERDDRTQIPGPVSTTAPGNTRALFRSTRGKELGLWPRTRVFVRRPGFITTPV